MEPPNKTHLGKQFIWHRITPGATHTFINCPDAYQPICGTPSKQEYRECPEETTITCKRCLQMIVDGYQEPELAESAGRY